MHRQSKFFINLSLFFLITICLFSTARAATFTVNSSGDTSDFPIGNGVCADSLGNCTLRAAIQESNALAGDDVIVFNITLPATITLNSTLGDISVSGALVINGLGADRLIISGNNATRIFTVNAGANLRINRLTIANGKFTGTTGPNGAPGSGEVGGAGGQAIGGAIVNNGTLTLFKVTVRDNQAQGGAGGTGGTGSGGAAGGAGGVGGAGGSATGGGIFNTGTLTILHSTFSNNQSIAGNGGAGGAGGSGTFSDGNGGAGGAGSSSSGGGLANTGTVFAVNSTITSNQSTGGLGGAGGAGASSGSPGQQGNGNGGGFQQSGGGQLNLRNVTISSNAATRGNGGGIFNSGTVNFGNTIVANNTATLGNLDLSGSFNSLGANLIESTTGTTITGTTTGNKTGVDPVLGALQSNGGETFTRAIGASSPATNAGNNSLAIDLSTGQPLTFDQRNFFSRFAGGTVDMGAFEFTATPRITFDFDGDGKTDISIFRPAPAEWWLSRSSNNQVFAAQFGATTDRITPGDFTGDGKTDIAFWRPSNGNWFVLRSEDLSFYSFPFGASGDIPAPADFDGDGKTDAAVFRPSIATWFINKSSGGTTIQQFGSSGDSPVVADYDGDGKSDLAIFRPNGANGAEWWYVKSSNGQTIALQFGISTDKPVQGDYTGDGKTDIAFFRPSTGSWFILRSEDNSFFAFPFGTSEDIPTPGDYDGDGKFDATIFRPSNSTWYVNQSTTGVKIVTFGINGDRPVPNAFVP